MQATRRVWERARTHTDETFGTKGERWEKKVTRATQSLARQLKSSFLSFGKNLNDASRQEPNNRARCGATLRRFARNEHSLIKFARRGRSTRALYTRSGSGRYAAQYVWAHATLAMVKVKRLNAVSLFRPQGAWGIPLRSGRPGAFDPAKKQTSN